MKVLESNFGLVCSIWTDTRASTGKVYYRICILKESMELVNSLVLPYFYSQYFTNFTFDLL